MQEYESEIWGFKNTEMCNKVHENAMKFYLGVAPLPALYGEMGSIAVKYRHYLDTFRFLNRMMKLPNTSITRHVLQRDIELSMTYTKKYSNFKQLLVRLPLYDES